MDKKFKQTLHRRGHPNSQKHVKKCLKSLLIKEMQIYPNKRALHINPEWLKWKQTKKFQVLKKDRKQSKLLISTQFSLKNVNWYNHFGKLLLNRRPKKSFSRLCTKGQNIYVHKQTYTRVLTAALFTTSANWKEPKVLISLFLLSLTDNSGMGVLQILKPIIISSVTQVGTGAGKQKVRGKVKQPVSHRDQMTRDGCRGTPQPCQKQEPTGRQKGKCQDWGTSQEGTQKTGLPAHHWSPRTSAHCPSRGLLPNLVRPAAAPPTQASPWLSVAPHHIFRESPKFLRSAFKPCQHVSPTFLLPLVFIPDSGYSRFLTPGPLHNTPVHLTSFHTFAPAVSATRTLWSLCQLPIQLQKPVQMSSPS